MQTIYLKTEVGVDHCGECIQLDGVYGQAYCKEYQEGSALNYVERELVDQGAYTQTKFLRLLICKKEALVGVEGFGIRQIEDTVKFYRLNIQDQASTLTDEDLKHLTILHHNQGGGG